MSTVRPDHLPPGYSSHPASRSQSQTRSGSPSTSNSPVDPNPSGRHPFGLPPGLNPTGKMASNSRSGAGSPSHDLAGASRLFSKRAREIQAQEGVPGLPLNPWGGPPTSGNSTPLRENIPESPTDGFPDFAQLPTPDSLPSTRRARAGTVPSRFSPGGVGNGPVISGLPKSARATPSQSPFNNSPSPNVEPLENASNSSTLLSRLRAGSMPQRSQFAPLPGTSSPFGPSIFSSWNPTGRERGATLASIASVGSTNGPSSPAQSQFSKEGTGESDVHMRTLDYLGLAETPQQSLAQLATPYLPSVAYAKQSSRFRSYSVNNKDKYADDFEEYEDEGQLDNPYINVSALQNQFAATQAAIHSHNLAVQAFTNQANTRPRARTAGILDTPGSRIGRSYLGSNSGMQTPIAASDILIQDEKEYDDLPQAVAGLKLGRSNSRNAGLLSAEEQGIEGPTSALWLGSVPTSTTTSTLVEMFKSHGPILSARVLTHKNCGFVNFERIESAISAKASMNSKEIFPGAGPIRINFAKPPSASNTPGHDGVFPSPSPDPFAKGLDATQGTSAAPAAELGQALLTSTTAPPITPLHEIVTDILEIVPQFEATDSDVARITAHLDSAVHFQSHVEEIPAVREPTHTRVHDAPKLRDIRKRIDNQVLSDAEIESIAIDMLPEIAELSSDYLGNTVVQKLFERCPDPIRDAMLAEIAPHLAEIGVHKNGTWAAQKIIDVCKTPSQMTMITENLRPYTVPLFLDQYGNYVVQGCLKFGSPYNDFIYETMLSHMWDISQGRYGARAVRACLESHHATKNQQRMLAAAIALRGVQLATNANGALLLTWFLDTCTFPHRRTVLSPRLTPYLVLLCTHKVAYLTVLKIINQKNEPDARDNMVNAMFFSPNEQVLEAILSDHTGCGALLIFKVLTTPFFDEAIRTEVVETIKSILIRLKPQTTPNVKRLMDEVGLSSRAGGGNRDANGHSEPRQRSTSRHGHTNGHHSHAQPAHANRTFHNPLNAGAGQPTFDMGYPQRPEIADPNMAGISPYGQPLMYGGMNGVMQPSINMQQLQYQQQMMGRGAPQMNYNFPPMQAGFGGYSSPSPSVDHLRQPNMVSGSPIPPSTQHMGQLPVGQSAFAPPPGFSMGMAPYGPYGGIGYMQQEQPNPRRGRR